MKGFSISPRSLPLSTIFFQPWSRLLFLFHSFFSPSFLSLYSSLRTSPSFLSFLPLSNLLVLVVSFLFFFFSLLCYSLFSFSLLSSLFLSCLLSSLFSLLSFFHVFSLFFS